MRTRPPRRRRARGDLARSANRPTGARPRPRSAPADVAADATMLVALLDDADPTVRAAALDGVLPRTLPGRGRRAASSLRSRDPRTAGRRDRRRAAARRPGRSTPERRAGPRRREAGAGPRAAARSPRSTASPSSRRRSRTPTAQSCSRRSRHWKRRGAVTSFRRTCSTACSTTPPTTPPARSSARASLERRTGRCTERWTTRSTSHAAS